MSDESARNAAPPNAAPPERYRVGDQPRDAATNEWEVFVRDRTDGPLRHVGSITAGSADEAYGRATRLFGWYASDVWLCPAAAMSRYSTHDLDGDATPVRVGGASGDSDGSDDRTEKRTYEP